MSQQTNTQFFESLVEDRNVPGAQLVIFFKQAFQEQAGRPEEQLRLFDLLLVHRPDLRMEAARVVIHGL